MSAWRWCAVAGLAALAISVSFGRIAGLTPCGDLGEVGAVIALELVQNTGDVARLFGSEPCTSRLIAAQRQALWLDLLAFIPAYLIFLMSGTMALRRAGLGFAMLAFNLVLIAATLDMLEGVILFKLLATLPGEARTFTGLFWMVRGKFLFLSLAMILLAAMLWRGALVAKLAAGVMAAGGVVALAYLFKAPHDPAMLKGHALAWIALLIVSAIGALRPALLGPTLLDTAKAAERG